MTSFTHPRRLFSLIAAPLVIGGLLLSVACGQPAAARKEMVGQPTVDADGTQQVTIRVGNAMSFEPNSVPLKAGQPVQVTLQNAGNMPHDFTLANGVAAPVKIAANGGQTAQGTFTIERPGTYTFVCSVSGHESAGMNGTLTVQ